MPDLHRKLVVAAALVLLVAPLSGQRTLAQNASPVGDWKCVNPPGTVPNQDEWIFYPNGQVTKIFTPYYGNLPASGNVTSQGTWSLQGNTLNVTFYSAVSCTNGFGCTAMNPGAPLAIPYQRSGRGIRLNIFECVAAQGSSSSYGGGSSFPPAPGRSGRSPYEVRNEIQREEEIIARCERLMGESTDPSVSYGCSSTISRARRHIMELEQELQ